jgi:hypothetical protein
MWRDPVVEETRERRERYGKRFDHDPDAIFEDVCKRQSEPGKKLVSFPARTAKNTPFATYPTLDRTSGNAQRRCSVQSVADAGHAQR